MSPDHIRPTVRRELEDFWRESVIAAETLYKADASETKRLRTLSDNMQNPDGAPALSGALDGMTMGGGEGPMANSYECPLDPRISEALTMLFGAHFDGDAMRIQAALRNLEF